MKINCCLLVFYVLLVTACDISIPLPEKEVEQVVVANALFSPDSIWQVQLTKSFALYQAGQVEFIANARVEVRDIDQGISTKLRHQRNGIYTTEEGAPIANNKYELIAQVEELKSIRAINQIPTPFTATVENYRFTNYRNLPSYLFQLKIEDTTQEANFYLVEVTYLIEKKDGLFTEKATHFSLDPNSDNESVTIDHIALKQSYLRDANFDGQAYLTEIGASSFMFNQLTDIEQVTAIISIKSISQEGYQHAKTVEEFEKSDSFSSPESINIFSNIDNGFGVFAGFTEQRIEVKLK